MSSFKIMSQAFGFYNALEIEKYMIYNKFQDIKKELLKKTILIKRNVDKNCDIYYHCFGLTNFWVIKHNKKHWSLIKFTLVTCMLQRFWGDSWIVDNNNNNIKDLGIIKAINQYNYKEILNQNYINNIREKLLQKGLKK